MSQYADASHGRHSSSSLSQSSFNQVSGSRRGGSGNKRHRLGATTSTQTTNEQVTDTTTSNNDDQKEELDQDERTHAMNDSYNLSSTTTSLNQTMMHTTTTTTAGANRSQVCHLLLDLLPNVLADLVLEYSHHELFDLWSDIMTAYGRLRVIPRKSAEHSEQTKQKGKPKKKKSKIDIAIEPEPMPKLQLSPPAPLNEINELEEEFRLKFGDPNFQFPLELKLLWSISDGLECSQNLLFRGRFWPSMVTMRAIVESIDREYYVLHHSSSYNHVDCFLKYDLRTGVFYNLEVGEEQEVEDLLTEHIVLIFHSIIHFMKVLLAVLKVSQDEDESCRIDSYRIHPDSYPYRWKSNLLVPAIHLTQLHGYVPPPHNFPKENYTEWGLLFEGDCGSPSADELIHGHLTNEQLDEIQLVIFKTEVSVQIVDDLESEPLMGQKRRRWLGQISSCHRVPYEDGDEDDEVNEDE